MEKQDASLRALRVNYERAELELADLCIVPIDLMVDWLQEAIDSEEVAEANIFTLATVNSNHQPSARILLLKGINVDGLTFYTNYKSKKGQQLESNPKAAMLFFWQELERQVRIEGTIEKLDEEVSLAYFKSRPKGSQVGAWASPQSKVIPDRAFLDDRVAELTDVYKEHTALPMPAHWGGYILKPHYFEFWQGRNDRLHDRFAYTLKDGEWQVDRLAP